jgi:hypothetical protein
MLKRLTGVTEKVWDITIYNYDTDIIFSTLLAVVWHKNFFSFDWSYFIAATVIKGYDPSLRKS